MITVTKTETTKTLVLKLIKSKVRKVTFSKETIDNEHLNKKKSKICCIFHSKNENKDRNKYERN